MARRRRTSRAARGILVAIVTACLFGATWSGSRWWQSQALATDLPASLVASTPTSSAPVASAIAGEGTPSTASSTPSPQPVLACAGAEPSTPIRVAIPGLAIDTDVERLVSANGSIGEPGNKQNIGWYPQWPSVKPGTGKGAVLLDGHTWHDDSAVFKESFKDVNKLGMVIDVTLDTGAHCFYEVTEQLTVLAKDYADTVSGRDLYDQDQARPETLVMATCSSWNGRTHLTESLFLATATNKR